MKFCCQREFCLTLKRFKNFFAVMVNMEKTKKKQNLSALLGIDDRKHKVIAVVGGGGKTSLIYRLAEEFLQRSRKVIITTTTHMAYEPERPFAPGGNPKETEELLESCGYVIAAEYEAKTDKFAALSKDKLLSLLNYEAVVLVEADGAKRKPVKVPAEWEPVIPDFADLVIGVIGLDCLFKPIKEAACRVEKTAKFLKKNSEELITPRDLIKIAASCEGLRKGAEKRSYRVYLNKSDVLSDIKPAEEIAENLKKQDIDAVYGSLKEAKIL